MTRAPEPWGVVACSASNGGTRRKMEAGRGRAPSWTRPTLPAPPPRPPPARTGGLRLRRSSAGHPGAAHRPTTLGDIAFRVPGGVGGRVQPPPTGYQSASPLPRPRPSHWKEQARRAHAGGRRRCDIALSGGGGEGGGRRRALPRRPNGTPRGGGGWGGGDGTVTHAAGGGDGRG